MPRTQRSRILVVGPRAVPVGPHTRRLRNGKTETRMLYRIPVHVTTNARECDMLGEAPDTTEHLILAYTPADAAAWALEHLTPHTAAEVTAVAFGPQGGKIRRWMSYYSWVWRELCAQRHQPRQQRLPFLVAEAC